MAVTRFLLVLLTRRWPRRRRKPRQLLPKSPLPLVRLRHRLKHLYLYLPRRETAAEQRADTHRSPSAVTQQLLLFHLSSRRRFRLTRPPQPRPLLLHLLLL